jgi:heme exporter protein CcmD
MSAMFDMGPYGTYVWSSMLLAAAIHAWNILSPALRRRELMRRLAEDDLNDPDNPA